MLMNVFKKILKVLTIVVRVLNRVFNPKKDG